MDILSGETVTGWVQLWWFMHWGILQPMTSWLLLLVRAGLKSRGGGNVFIWDQIYIKLESNSKTLKYHTPCMHDLIIQSCVCVRVQLGIVGVGVVWTESLLLPIKIQHSLPIYIHIIIAFSSRKMWRAILFLNLHIPYCLSKSSHSAPTVKYIETPHILSRISNYYSIVHQPSVHRNSYECNYNV